MILTIYRSLMTLVITTNYYLLNTSKSLSYFKITLNLYILLLKYSGFLLRVSAWVFSIPLIYIILKLYITSIST